MPKIMLINVTHSEESRVGILNEGVLEAFEIEALSRAHLKGNIYKGVVHRIHPALEAAFVDIGAERDAFLPLDEICFKNLPERPKPKEKSNGSGGRRQLRIRDVLRPGQELLVQITKEQFANKPPTLSTFYSLPGRYLVLLPGSDDTGISRRIEGDERDRLRKAVDAIKKDEGFGLIVRTVAGLEETKKDLAHDLDYLQRLWSSVQASAGGQPAPSLVYREHDIVQRAIRDFYTPDIGEIYIDDEDVYERAKEFLSAFMPGSEAVLKLYRGEQPMFSAFQVEDQIESVFERRVRLRSGGSIVIDGTEALTAIDVNSGGAVRGANPEETAFRTNREAAAEVARQMRLRDIGGIIVVDFIDMRDPKHIREIEQRMRDEMRLDKARHETSRISSLGLMEISRQRLRPAAANTSHATCPLCQGFGSVRASASAALAAIRKVHNRLSLGDVESMRVTLPTSVGLYVLNQKREDLANLEARYESLVEVRLSDTLLPHEAELEVKERSRAASNGKKLEPGTVAAPQPKSKQTESADGASDNGGDGRKRRRRRRRRKPDEAGADSNGAQANGAAAEAAAKDSADSAGDTASKETPSTASAEASGDGAKPASGSRSRRSRGRRGGRRRSGRSRGEQTESGAADTASSAGSASSPTADRSAAAANAAQASSPSSSQAAAETRPAATGEKSADKPAASETSPPKAAAEQSDSAKPDAAASAKPASKRAAKKTTTRKATAKKTTTKKAAAKKTTAKKTTTKKAAAKKTTTKKRATKKTAAKKTTAKKAADTAPASTSPPQE